MRGSRAVHACRQPDRHWWGSTSALKSTLLSSILKFQAEISLYSLSDILSSSEDIDTHTLLGQPRSPFRRRRHEDPAAGGPSLISDLFHMRQSKPHRFSIDSPIHHSSAYIPFISSSSLLSLSRPALPPETHLPSKMDKPLGPTSTDVRQPPQPSNPPQSLTRSTRSASSRPKNPPQQ